MIIQENLTINEKEFIKQYSDKGFKLERDGEPYDEAIDPIEYPREYTETDIPIEPIEEEKQ